LTRVYLRLPGKKPKPCILEGWRAHQGRALITVDRSQGRDQAEAWRGADVAGQELWFIHDEDGNEIMLPAVDEFIRGIDLDAGVILVDPPDGLLELYQQS
jgi:16S rRNA processing protein RimM